MSVFCACALNSVNGNTGTSSAALQLKRLACLYFVYRVADDGTENVILESDFVDGVLPADFIAGKINHTDPSKRWYPVSDLRSITNERADPETQTFDGGQNSVITTEGLRTFTALVIDQNAKYKKNLDKLSCEDLAFFEVDECGALGGEEDPNDSTIFKPHRIAKKTFYVNLNKATGTDAQTLQIQFEYDQRSDDANECIIPASALGSALCDLEGLLNLLVTYSAITNTSFTATLRLEYGGFPGGVPQTDLVLADFVLNDNTAGSPVSISSVTESADGVYDFVTSAMVATNKMQLQIASTGDKYDKEGFEIQTKTFDAVA